MADNWSVLTEQDSARASGRNEVAVCHVAWNGAEISPRAATCGRPFGLAPDKLWPPPPGGIYARRFDGAETCGESCCPVCGREQAVRRCCLATLALGEHLAQGRLAVFLSIAGRHRADEPISEVFRRLKVICEQIPGNPQIRRLIEAEFGGRVRYIRRVEGTFGGANGCHPNAHIVFLLDLPAEEDADEVAERFAIRVRAVLLKWAYKRRGMPDIWQAMEAHLSDHAWDCRVAGLDVAEYLAKLDGAGLAKTAMELVDVHGGKQGRNIGDRALPFWLADQARMAGYGPSKFRKAFRELPHLAEMIAEAREFRRVSKGVQLWRGSEGLFDEWRHLGTGELVARAAEFCAAETTETMRRLLESEKEVEGGPFDEDLGETRGESPPVSVTDEPVGELPPRWSTEVWFSGSAAQAWRAWVAEHPGVDGPGAMYGGICGLLDERGPWGSVLAVGANWLETMGERLFVYRRGGVDPDTPEVVILTDEADLEDVGAWELVAWSEVRDRADNGARWVRLLPADVP